MGTDDRTVDRQAVFEALVRALHEHHGGVHARDMATAVFRHARGSRALVGLADAGGRSVFYEANARTLTAVPLDEHGLTHARAESLWTGLDDPTAWVDAHGDDLDWVHPRYRWVLDVERSAGMA